MQLGAYLMGGLPEDEAIGVRAHLAICAECRAEHDEMAPVPGWLDLLALDPDSDGSEVH
jgi:anti-sigma factor RsiW